MRRVELSPDLGGTHPCWGVLSEQIMLHDKAAHFSAQIAIMQPSEQVKVEHPPAVPKGQKLKAVQNCLQLRRVGHQSGRPKQANRSPKTAIEMSKKSTRIKTRWFLII